MSDGKSGEAERCAIQLKLIVQPSKQLSLIDQIKRLQLDRCGQNMIQYAAIESIQKDYLAVDSNGNLILTGWGYAEYVASAAVALKALPAPQGELVADFGGAVKVGGFAFTPGTGKEEPPKGYQAQASDDAKAWRDLGSDEFSNILANPISQDVRFSSPVTTRYLRLVAVPFPGETPDWSTPGAKVEFPAP